MDSFEFNKIAAAVIAALLLMVGMPTLQEVLHHSGDHHEAKAAYKLPDAEVSSDTASASSQKKGFEFAQVASLFGEASADSGAAVFKKCASCHTVNDGGKNGIGPNLWDIVGRGRGAHEGFKYSNALVEKGGVWDYESLTLFIHKPKEWLRGTKMAFAGLRSEKDLANLMAYLKTLSGSPKPFPEAPAATPAASETPEVKTPETK